MGLDTYAALVTVEDGKRQLDTHLPGRVNYTTTYSAPDGQLVTYTQSVATGFEGVPSLTGGMMSGNGNNGSFRGKCYAELVEEVTGYSLYEDELPPPVVNKMASMLRQASDENPLQVTPEQALKEMTAAWETGHNNTIELAYELNALACWFEACASQGYSVIGWW
jgi:hypothetical protein